MANNGIRRGDKIFMCVTGTPEAVEIILACSKVGACAVMVNPTITGAENRITVSGIEAGLFFCMDELYSSVREAFAGYAGKTVIVPATSSLPIYVRAFASLRGKIRKSIRPDINSVHLCGWKQFLREPEAPFDESTDEYADLTIEYTSGTTGKPKGIVHTNHNYNALIAEHMCNGYRFETGDAFLTNIPFFIAAGLSYPLFVPLGIGLTVMLDPIYSPEALINDILKYHPNYVAATKSFWYSIIGDERIQNTDLSFIRIPFSGGEPILKEDEAAINSFLKKHNCTTGLYVGYGMSEFNATVTSTSVYGNTPGSVGIPLPHVTLSTFDLDSGAECKYNEYGEIRVLHPCVMREYYLDRERTDAFFSVDSMTGNRWGRTGDIGYINEKGEVFVLGRASESYFSKSGRRVYLFDIASTIGQYPAVRQCKVIAINTGETSMPIAHIVLKEMPEDIGTMTERIREYCNSHLESDCCPLDFVYYEEFPVTPNGKIDNQRLMEQSYKAIEGKKQNFGGIGTNEP